MIAPADDQRRPADQLHAGSPPAERSAPTVVDADDVVKLALRFREAVGTVESFVTGHSMHSTLPAGSRIRIRCGDPGAVRRGAVVAFVGGSSLMAHRVVGRGRGTRSRQFLLTRGDATIICDAPIHTDDVLGVVTHVATGDQWQSLPSVQRPLVERVASGVIAAAMQAALELDARAARTVAATCFRLRAVTRGVSRRVRRMLGAR